MDTPRREPWLFGPENTALIREAIRQRYSLLPYWYQLFYTAHHTGQPVMRYVCLIHLIQKGIGSFFIRIILFLIIIILLDFFILHFRFAHNKHTVLYLLFLSCFISTTVSLYQTPMDNCLLIYLDWHVLGLWEENGASGRTQTHGKNMQTDSR